MSSNSTRKKTNGFFDSKNCRFMVSRYQACTRLRFRYFLFLLLSRGLPKTAKPISPQLTHALLWKIFLANTRIGANYLLHCF